MDSLKSPGGIAAIVVAVGVVAGALWFATSRPNNSSTPNMNQIPPVATPVVAPPDASPTGAAPTGPGGAPVNAQPGGVVPP
jgi:hypothetical protein